VPPRIKLITSRVPHRNSLVFLMRSITRATIQSIPNKRSNFLFARRTRMTNTSMRMQCWFQSLNEWTPVSRCVCPTWLSVIKITTHQHGQWKVLNTTTLRWACFPQSFRRHKAHASQTSRASRRRGTFSLRTITLVCIRPVRQVGTIWVTTHSDRIHFNRTQSSKKKAVQLKR
jgi:hypothetical protein